MMMLNQSASNRLSGHMSRVRSASARAPYTAAPPAGLTSPATFEIASADAPMVWELEGASVLAVALSKDDDAYALLTDTEIDDPYPGYVIQLKFDLSQIPDDAVVTDVTVSLLAFTDSDSATIPVRLRLGTVASQPQEAYVTTYEEYKNLSGWGAFQLDTATIKSEDFNVALTACTSHPGAWIYVDHLQLVVTWE